MMTYIQRVEMLFVLLLWWIQPFSYDFLIYFMCTLSLISSCIFIVPVSFSGWNFFVQSEACVTLVILTCKLASWIELFPLKVCIRILRHLVIFVQNYLLQTVHIPSLFFTIIFNLFTEVHMDIKWTKTILIRILCTKYTSMHDKIVCKL